MKRFAVAAVAGLLLISAVPLQAGDYRFGTPRADDQSAIQRTAASQAYPVAYHSGYHTSTVNYGGHDGYNCPHCQQQSGFAPRHHDVGWGKAWLVRGHYCTHSPDHGWGVPRHRPIHRQSAQYVNYWPSAWYGQPGGGAAAAPQFPVAAMPTDTAQLGYYYQHVPSWQANRSMLPPVPRPSQWHDRGQGNGACYGAVQYGNVTWQTVPGGTQVIEETSPPAEADGGDAAPMVPPPAPEAFNDSIQRQGVQRANYDS